jgi:hypothetical protein
LKKFDKTRNSFEDKNREGKNIRFGSSGEKINFLEFEWLP